MLNDVGGWLKEQFRFIFFGSSDIQKPKQTLQKPLSPGEQKAFSLINHSTDSAVANPVDKEKMPENARNNYFEYLTRYLLEVEMLHVRPPVKMVLHDIFIEPDLSLALPYANEFPLSTLLLTPPSSSTQQEQADIWSRLAAHHAYVILGPPGSGKTSLLLHLIMDIIDKKYNKIPNKLPILLFLRDYSEVIYQKPHYTLPQAIDHSLKANQLNPSPASSWFEEQLTEGECLVMLDSLNEVPKDKCDVVLRWIERQLEIYHKNIFIVTSRPVGYQHALKRCIVLNIEPFTSEQVERFVKRWVLVNETQRNNISRSEDEKSSSPQKAQELCTLIAQPEFSHLRDNPLRLTMMTTIFQHKGTLPHRQVDLYAEYIDLLLQTRRLGNQFNLTPDKKRGVLQVLAYQMMEQNLVEITEDEAVRAIYVPLDMVSRNPKGAEFIELIAKESGLLRQSRGGYRFEPLFLQEYLAALRLVERRELSEMIKHVQSSWWHETLRLCAIHTGSTEIIKGSLQVIMTRQRNDALTGHLPALQLAISCAQEMNTEIKEEILHQLQRILELQVDASDPVQRRLVAETLLDWRLSRMMRVNQDLYVDDSLITNAEYRLFIEEQRLSNPEPNNQFKMPFLADSGQKAVTGLQASDAVAFCEWLNKRDKLGLHYRLPYSGEFSPLVSKIGYWTQKEHLAYELEEQPRHELSLRGLESRLRSLIARDIAHDPDSALARLSKFESTLEQAFDDKKRHRTFALGLARDFVHDRAHSRVNNDNQPTSHSEHSTWYAHFVAWLVTHQLLTLLREEPKPRSWLEQFDRHRIIIPPFEQKALAEEYFELYNDLANLEEGSLGTLVTNRGIRIVGEHRLSTRVSHKRKVLQKKICLVGDEGVGKTSLVRRFVEGRFEEKYLSTMGVSISRKTVEQPTYTMNMVIWDMEGAEGFQKMQLNYLRGAAGALIVCDLTRRKTFVALELYARQLQKLNPTMPIVFIGNKIDMPLRQITAQDLDSISATPGKPYLLTSAKTGTQVEEVFCLLANLIETQDNSSSLLNSVPKPI